LPKRDSCVVCAWLIPTMEPTTRRKVAPCRVIRLHVIASDLDPVFLPILQMFSTEDDYAAFERVLEGAFRREPLRILGYCVMPDHWHLVVWPEDGKDRQVSEFLRWLTVTHTQRWHAQRQTSGTGHLYQGRFKSFPVESVSTSTRSSATSSATRCVPIRYNGLRIGAGQAPGGVIVATKRLAGY
jgi:REP element-mobilizing transposase RayT